MPELYAPRYNFFSPIFIGEGIKRDKFFTICFCQERLNVGVGFNRIVLARQKKNIIKIHFVIKQMRKTLECSTDVAEISPMTGMPFKKYNIGKMIEAEYHFSVLLFICSLINMDKKY